MHIVGHKLLICTVEKDASVAYAVLLWICTYYLCELSYPSEGEQPSMAAMLCLLQVRVLAPGRPLPENFKRPPGFNRLQNLVKLFTNSS